MEILKEELKKVVIKTNDTPFEFQERLINEINNVIDNYVEEEEKKTNE